jgi:hypothetical protein
LPGSSSIGPLPIVVSVPPSRLTSDQRARWRRSSAGQEVLDEKQVGIRYRVGDWRRSAPDDAKGGLCMNAKIDLETDVLPLGRVVGSPSRDWLIEHALAVNWPSVS